MYPVCCVDHYFFLMFYYCTYRRYNRNQLYTVIYNIYNIIICIQQPNPHNQYMYVVCIHTWRFTTHTTDPQ